MSDYIIPDSGGTINIGLMLDFTDGRTPVDISLIKSDITAEMDVAQVVISEVSGNDYAGKLTITGNAIVGSLGTVAWITPYNQTEFEVEDGAVFEAGQILTVSASGEKLLVVGVAADVITVERGYDDTIAEGLEDGLTLTVSNHGSETVGSYAADAEVIEITVVDGSQFAVGETMTTAAGETIEVVSIDGDVLTVDRDELNLGIIGDGEFLAVNGLESDIAVGNIWDDRAIKTALNVADASIFRVGDVLEAGDTLEEMQIDYIDYDNDIITVERGYNGSEAAYLWDTIDITVMNRAALIPTGSNTLIIKNSGSSTAIVPRNIPVQVVSQAAYDQMFGGAVVDRFGRIVG